MRYVVTGAARGAGRAVTADLGPHGQEAPGVLTNLPPRPWAPVDPG